MGEAFTIHLSDRDLAEVKKLARDRGISCDEAAAEVVRGSLAWQRLEAEVEPLRRRAAEMGITEDDILNWPS